MYVDRCQQYLMVVQNILQTSFTITAGFVASILCAQRMKCFQSLRSMERKSQIKVLHTDNGWEYTPKQFEDYLKMKELCTRKLYHILPNKMVSQRDLIVPSMILHLPRLYMQMYHVIYGLNQWQLQCIFGIVC